MPELCDSEKFVLYVISSLSLLIGGLIIPFVGPYIKKFFTGVEDRVSPQSLGWSVWIAIIFFTGLGIYTGGKASISETKLCNQIRIVEIECDSTKGDKGVTEFVTLQNQDDHEISLDQWKVCDYQSKHCYTFQPFRLAPQASVMVWTGHGNDTDNTLYWNSESAIWNDGEDTASLIDKKDRLIDQIACPPLPTSTATPSPTFTLTPSSTPTPTFTPTFTATPTSTPTYTPSPTYTPTSSITPIALIPWTGPTYDPLQGVTAICKDGTYSYSKHRQGTCSHHGGVKQWINKPSN